MNKWGNLCIWPLLLCTVSLFDQLWMTSSAQCSTRNFWKSFSSHRSCTQRKPCAQCSIGWPMRPSWDSIKPVWTRYCSVAVEMNIAYVPVSSKESLPKSLVCIIYLWCVSLYYACPHSCMTWWPWPLSTRCCFVRGQKTFFLFLLTTWMPSRTLWRTALVYSARWTRHTSSLLRCYFPHNSHFVTGSSKGYLQWNM